MTFESLILEALVEPPSLISLDDGDSRPVLTRYERARAIGVRARQIGDGSVVHVDVTGMQDEVNMATKELNEGKCPLVVRRHYPDHSAGAPHFDDFHISDMRLR